ncbi:hypothetical protein HZH68_009250 [Vespula germanica]|uniref:Uncharacterized protein n=1 Tax=Vespula germanica TaxID=30212 RepID=A0A834JW34_VESGE|nr:hypothetical protein HZH68_009250 [Vespula germanica]
MGRPFTENLNSAIQRSLEVSEVPELDLRGTSQHPLSPFAPDSTREALCCVLDIWETPSVHVFARVRLNYLEVTRSVQWFLSRTVVEVYRGRPPGKGELSEWSRLNGRHLDRGGRKTSKENCCKLSEKSAPSLATVRRVEKYSGNRKYQTTRVKTSEAFARTWKARRSMILRLGENSAKGQRSLREDKSRRSSSIL